MTQRSYAMSQAAATQNRTPKTDIPCDSARADSLARPVQPLLALVLPCLCFLATALILEGADILRHQSVSDDTLLPSITGFIHPAVLVFLLLGYGVAVGAIVHSILVRWKAQALRPVRSENLMREPSEAR